ncbi:MAG: pseudouridine-5'-phosphate glycosidase [Gammaproteobacteria bacterium]|nr:pseudouridine-5'-phosphate glycosidase [Gammaproteobacteria bacterium]
MLKVSNEVRDALACGQAVVALESTIISHGMPYPQNAETALEVEQVVRHHGAVPATIALFDGELCVGLEAAQIQRLGQEGLSVIKCSRRDLGAVLAAGRTGATTVASTMIGAHLAGIKIFATGGIGGVHRGAETSMDISADLTELGRTPVAVVCAGAKAILDLPLTLEYLETLGVPVFGYQTKSLPAFYSRQSDLEVDYQMDTAEAVAAALNAQWQLGLTQGALIANPVPEANAIDKAEMDKVIDQALTEADAQGIKGKASTPFLLARVAELTGGTSLQTNIALVKHNAAVAAQTAVALAALEG